MKVSAQNITEGMEIMSSDSRNGAVAESDAEFAPGTDDVVIWLAGAPRRFKSTQMVEVS